MRDITDFSSNRWKSHSRSNTSKSAYETIYLHPSGSKIFETSLTAFASHDAKYYAQTALGEYNDLPLYRGTNYVINARDGIRQGDDSETPLQFVYEPADCRIYYTPEMAVDQSAAWKTVADTAFNGINHCVAGDYGGKYSGSYGSEKRSADSRPKHAVSDIDISEHYRAMAEVWTGRGGMVLNGDSLMPI